MAMMRNVELTDNIRSGTEIVAGRAFARWNALTLPQTIGCLDVQPLKTGNDVAIAVAQLLHGYLSRCANSHVSSPGMTFSGLGATAVAFYSDANGVQHKLVAHVDWPVEKPVV